MYESRRYEARDRDAVFAFLRSVYPPARSARLIAQWDWKYAQYPFRAEAGVPVRLMWDGDRVISLLGSAPVRVTVHGREHWAAQFGDWVTHPDYRQQRIWNAIGWNNASDCDIGFGWANAASQRHAAATAPDSGFFPVRPLVKPLDPLQLLSLAKASRRGGQPSVRGERPPYTPPGLEIRAIERFDASADALWERVRPVHPVMVMRDRQYLNWRYIDRPDAHYTVIGGWRGTDLMGYAVGRLTQRAELPWAYLVDFLVEPSSRTLLPHLVAAVVDPMKRAGAAAMSCLVGPRSRSAMYRQGFLPVPWLQPTYFLAYVYAPNPALESFRDTRQWYFTMGDGDVELAS